MTRIQFYLSLLTILFIFFFAVIPLYLTFMNMLPIRTTSGLSPRDFNLNYEPISMVSFDGVPIKAWLIHGKENYPCIIMVHGKGAAKDGLLPLAQILNAQGYHIMLPDLRGHGESGDALITFGLHEARDLEITIDAVIRRDGIDTERIGVYAQSMGAGAAIIGLADRPEVKGFFIDSGFDNLELLFADVASTFYRLPYWLGKCSTWTYKLFTGVSAVQVNPALHLSRVDKPLLMLHSPLDKTIPFERAKKLYEAAAGKKELIEIGGDHTGGWSENPEQYKKMLEDFFNGLFKKNPES